MVPALRRFAHVVAAADLVQALIPHDRWQFLIFAHNESISVFGKVVVFRGLQFVFLVIWDCPMVSSNSTLDVIDLIDIPARLRRMMLLWCASIDLPEFDDMASALRFYHVAWI